MLHKVYPQPADMYPRVWSVYPKAWDRQTKTEEHFFSLYLPTLSFILRKFFFNSLNVFC
ncbi:hypothetical protein HMPREF2141_02612 [Bacteroides uniformis]|nr:hypothetical protein HMPREF2141_02612 [Bacteroides uniformis]